MLKPVPEEPFIVPTTHIIFFSLTVLLPVLETTLVPVPPVNVVVDQPQPGELAF